MKKIILILVMILSLTGCGKTKELNIDEISNELIKTNLFTETEKIEISYLENKYGLDTTGIEEYSVFMALDTVSASMYAIFKVNDIVAKENIEFTFIDKYISSWTTLVYEPEEVKLVNDMYTKEYGNYLIYVVSKDNEKVNDIINDILKK